MSLRIIRAVARALYLRGDAMTRKTLLGIVVLLYCAGFSFQAEARTWPTARHSDDRGFKAHHVFNEFRPVANYQDPDFAEGAEMASPLYNPIYASYDVVIVINKSTRKSGAQLLERGQRVRVYAREAALNALPRRATENLHYHPASGLLYYWKVSTARAGKVTPGGHFRVESFSSEHRSSRYNNSPMPFTIFFNGNIATHGVLPSYYGNLGQTASAGCVRLETQRAKDLFHLIGMVGRGVVDLISRAGNLVGSQATAYKSLYIVRD